jgi:hypothetical protein
MPMPTQLKNALDTLWDEIRVDRTITQNRITLGGNQYKIRIYKKDNDSYIIEITKR